MSLEKLWVKAIKTTGAVGVVGFLFSLLINKLFNEKIIEALGSERMFFIIVLMTCVLMVVLVFAIDKKGADKEKADMPRSNDFNNKIDITYSNQSTHNGDNNFKL